MVAAAPGFTCAHHALWKVRGFPFLKCSQKLSKHFCLSEASHLIAQSTTLGHKLPGECRGLTGSGNHSDKGFVIVLVDLDQRQVTLGAFVSPAATQQGVGKGWV